MPRQTDFQKNLTKIEEILQNDCCFCRNFAEIAEILQKNHFQGLTKKVRAEYGGEQVGTCAKNAHTKPSGNPRQNPKRLCAKPFCPTGQDGFFVIPKTKKRDHKCICFQCSGLKPPFQLSRFPLQLPLGASWHHRVRPSLHHLAPLIEQIVPEIGAHDLIPDRMIQAFFGNMKRDVFPSAPVAKC